MRILTFFSEKGGVGKSTFTIMYASWLHFKCGVKVGVADFNDRINKYRYSEIEKREELRKEKPEVPSFDMEDTWPIVSCRPSEIRDIRKTGVQKPYAAWLKKQIMPGGALHGLDVVLCDFPGSLTGGEFLDIASLTMLNLVVIPTERDEMTLNSTKKLHEIIHKYVRECIFINKVNVNLQNTRSAYFKLGEKLLEVGFPMLPDMVSYSEKMMTIEKVSNIRSTFGYPDYERDENGCPKDLGIGNLFIDVTRLLLNERDYPGTGQSDLSFVENLQKANDGRQLPNSAFPELHIK
ncbi:MAG: ParA family protein [Bacteroidales bacterium]|nr:ParA family protein [Bacteroidales bacterium]